MILGHHSLQIAACRVHCGRGAGRERGWKPSLIVISEERPGGHAPGRGAQGDQGESRIYAAHRDTPRPYAHCGVAGQCAERVSLDRRDRTRESRASAFVFLISFIHTRARAPRRRGETQAETARPREGAGGAGVRLRVAACALALRVLGARAPARENPRAARTHTRARARGAAESSRRGRDSFSQKELTSHARRLGALEHARLTHGHERPHTQWAVPCAASKRKSMASRRHPRKRQYKSHPARKSFCEKQRRRQSAEGIKGRTADSGIGYRRLGSRGSRQWRGAHLRAQ